MLLAILLHMVVHKSPRVIQLMKALRFEVTSTPSEELHGLPLTTVGFALPSFRPDDSLIMKTTSLSGVPAFIELLDVKHRPRDERSHQGRAREDHYLTRSSHLEHFNLERLKLNCSHPSNRSVAQQNAEGAEGFGERKGGLSSPLRTSVFSALLSGRRAQVCEDFWGPANHANHSNHPIRVIGVIRGLLLPPHFRAFRGPLLGLRLCRAVLSAFKTATTFFNCSEV
ncbi:MAG: hypothetical protein WDN28_05975 [Chthoniobacter sp.]